VIGRRARRLLILLAACALAIGAGASTALAASAPGDLTLRLTDLDPGFSLFFGPCETEPALAETTRFENRNCVIEFTRFWTAPGAQPGPVQIYSAAAVFANARRAAAALAYPRYTASEAFGPDREDYEVVAPAPAIGDEAVLLRVDDGSVAVIWRSGAVLAALLADNGFRSRARVDLQAALALAAKQQARIAAPTPLQPSENDDSQVALDDPGLDLPVYWLDRVLPRHGQLPPLRLLGSLPSAFVGSGDDLGPALTYGRPGAQAGVVFFLARPPLLRRPAMRRELRHMRRNPCSIIRHLTLSDRRATIFQRSPRCPKLDVRKTPDALADTTAVVVLPGVVALIYADDCVSCHGPVSRYESIAGMRRIVRALRLRELRGATTP